ncbi:MAG: hypothetical protein ACI8X5_001089 [Planctomycetota bacterium]
MKASNSHPEWQFGSSVSLSGDTLAVGAVGEGGQSTGVNGDESFQLPWKAGAAYIYRRAGTTWTQEAYVKALNTATMNHFGWDVATSGTLAAVGALTEDSPSPGINGDQPQNTTFGNYGAVYVINLNVQDVGAPYCFGDGTSNACPCANTGQAGAGCATSNSNGATLAAIDSSSVSADTLTFNAEGLIPGAPALLFSGSSQLAAGVSFGDGLRCVGGTIVRMQVATPSASGQASWGPLLGQSYGFGAGSSLNFQVWFRDTAGSCGSGFNLSNGLSLLFTP